jgi:hypothetical protein
MQVRNDRGVSSAPDVSRDLRTKKFLKVAACLWQEKISGFWFRPTTEKDCLQKDCEKELLMVYERGWLELLTVNLPLDFVGRCDYNIVKEGAAKHSNSSQLLLHASQCKRKHLD